MKTYMIFTHKIKYNNRGNGMLNGTVYDCNSMILTLDEKEYKTILKILHRTYKKSEINFAIRLAKKEELK